MHAVEARAAGSLPIIRGSGARFLARGHSLMAKQALKTVRPPSGIFCPTIDSRERPPPPWKKLGSETGIKFHFLPYLFSSSTFSVVFRLQSSIDMSTFAVLAVGNLITGFISISRLASQLCMHRRLRLDGRAVVLQIRVSQSCSAAGRKKDKAIEWDAEGQRYRNKRRGKLRCKALWAIAWFGIHTWPGILFPTSDPPQGHAASCYQRWGLPPYLEEKKKKRRKTKEKDKEKIYSK